MLNSLKPREETIEMLKDNLLRLEEVFEQQMKSMQGIADELEKFKTKYMVLETDLRNQEEFTKEKKEVILKFAQDVHKIVQTKDEKAYVTGIMKLNQDYVMSSIAFKKDGGKSRDPEQVEDLEHLDRKMKHAERQLAQLKNNDVKNETQTEKDTKKKIKENTQLIVDLNAIKFADKK